MTGIYIQRQIYFQRRRVGQYRFVELKDGLFIWVIWDIDYRDRQRLYSYSDNISLNIFFLSFYLHPVVSYIAISLLDLTS
jgi:hypothetical protein